MIKAFKNKLASWMAIFAVLCAFFAPTVSQAMSADNHTGHCAFCCTSAHTPIISSASITIVIALIESQAWKIQAYDSPVVQSFDLVSNSPQAPPSI